MRLTKMAAGVAVLGLVLAACGEDGESADGTSGGGSDDSTAAAESGDDAGDDSGDDGGEESGGSQEISISQGEGGGAELFDAMTAAYEEAGSYHFEMEMEAQGMQVSAEGAAEFGSDASETNMTLTMQVPDQGEMSMRLVDGQFFMSLPPEAGMPIDTPWLLIDPQGDNPMAESFGSLAADMSLSAELQSDFAENAELITVEEGGTDTMDGVEVTEYLLTVESEDAAAFMESTGQATEGAVPTGDITYSLWVDGDQLPRRITADLGEAGSMEMRFFDFGEPVEVEAPPEDEVTDFSSLMEDMSQSQ